MTRKLDPLFSGEDYGSVLFSLVMVFVPMDFSMIRFLTRHYVMQDE